MEQHSSCNSSSVGAFDMTKYKISFLAIAVLALSLCFQNCGKSFEADPELQAYFAESSRAPDIRLITAPLQLAKSRIANFQFEYEPNQYTQIKTVECSVDGLPPSDCTNGSFTANDLTDGSHTLIVKAKDLKGHTAQYPEFEWIVDATLPALNVVTGPPDFLNNRTSTISFTARDNESGLVKTECSLNAGAYATCASPVQLLDLQEIRNNFKIKVTDKAGNSTIVDQNWLVDVTLPVVIFNTAPPAILAKRTFSVAFSGTDAGSGVAGFECAYDTNTFTACTSPLELANMGDGNHSLKLRAKDKALNISLLATANWVVDTTAPLITLNSTVGEFSNQTTQTFTFSGTDNNQPLNTFTCKLDDGAFAPCTSPTNVTNLQDGLHSFSLIGIDAAGNESSPLTRTFTIDTVRPTVSITAHPEPINTNSFRFEFTAQDNLSGVFYTQCSVNADAFRRCASPFQVNNLILGSNELIVQAVDIAGNPSELARANLVVVKKFLFLQDFTAIVPLVYKQRTNYVYTGRQVIDFTNPASLSYTGYSLNISASALTIADNKLYHASANEVEISDLTSLGPTAPNNRQVKTLPWTSVGTSPDFSFDIDAVGNNLYGCWGKFNTQSTQVRIAAFDITGTPILKGTLESSSSTNVPNAPSPVTDTTRGCTVDGNVFYVRRSFSVARYESQTDGGIGNTQQFDGLGTYFGEPYSKGIMVGGDPFAARPNDLRVVDVRRDGAGQLATIPIPFRIDWVHFSNGYLLVHEQGATATVPTEIRLYDMSQPSNPKLVGTGLAPIYYHAIVAFPRVYLSNNTVLSLWFVQ